MSDWEEKLPPIMREKLAKIGDLSPEERERIKAANQISALLAEFYKGDIDADGLWKKFKVFKDTARTDLLRDAQLQLTDSLTLNSSGTELQKRKAAIIAIETLKGHGSTASLEQTLNLIDALQARSKKETQQNYDYLKSAIERNPQLRMQQVRQGNQTVVVQLSVDEAIKSSQEWRNFLAEHDNNFSQEFSRIIDKLKKQVK